MSAEEENLKDQPVIKALENEWHFQLPQARFTAQAKAISEVIAYSRAHYLALSLITGLWARFVYVPDFGLPLQKFSGIDVSLSSYGRHLPLGIVAENATIYSHGGTQYRPDQLIFFRGVDNVSEAVNVSSFESSKDIRTDSPAFKAAMMAVSLAQGRISEMSYLRS